MNVLEWGMSKYMYSDMYLKLKEQAMQWPEWQKRYYNEVFATSTHSKKIPIGENMQNKKYKILALFGESGAGKDFIQKYIIKTYPNAKGIVSCTTRPPRSGESEGVDYHFLTVEQFTEKVLNGDMLEATSFRDWFYGTAIDELDIDKINIGVFNIQGIEILLQDSRLEIYPVYIWADGITRLLRSCSREISPNAAEICRRYLADEKDFASIDFDYETIDNSNDFMTHELRTDIDRVWAEVINL